MASQCPTQSLQSYPVELQGFKPTYEMYESVIEPISLSFTWGSDSTIPEFSSSADINSGEISHPSIYTTRLTYANTNYTLDTVQLTTASHTNWLALTDSEALAVNNLEDIVLTFTSEPIAGSEITKNPQYIILVSPIIRTVRPRTSSSFLDSFANRARANVSLHSLFPNKQNNQYARYITCSQGINSMSDFQNVLVVVNVQGLIVLDSIMENIKTLYTKQKTGTYPLYHPIHSNLFSTQSAVISSFMFSSFIKVSHGYASSVETVSTPPVLDENTDAYKCVPLDPTTQVNGIGMKVNSSTGTILTNELTTRQQEIDNYNTKEISSIPYKILEKYTRIFIIIAISIAGIVIIVYSVLSITSGPETTGVGGDSMFKTALENILKVPIYVVIAFFCTFVGLMVGAFVKPI